MHLLHSAIVGFVVGWVARAVLPGADPMGLLPTIAVGIVGSMIGGFIGGRVVKPDPQSSFHPPGFFLSVVGAVLLLTLIRLAA